MVALQTTRIKLRELEPKDWQAVSDYASDLEVVRFMNWGPNTKEDTKNFIKRAIVTRTAKPRQSYSLAVVLKEENKLIGGCGITISDPDNREGWIGYVFNRHYWGRGYATETARALIAFGFRQLGLHRIYATCDPANTASARVMEKGGMQCEGHFREKMCVKGTWRDVLVYAILDHEWAKTKMANVT